MSKSIDEFKRFVEFVTNKAQTGNTVTPTQFNEIANRAQMQIFERDYKQFLMDKTITEFLSSFLKNTSLIIDSFGNASYPSDYQHGVSMRSYYGIPGGQSVEVEVKEEDNYDWGKLQVSQLFVPDKRFPKFSHFATEMRFLPRDLAIAQLDYLATPPKPVWNYTVVSNAPVYAASGSVDFLWDDYATNEVAAVYLSIIQCNLKDGDLAQFAQMFKAES